ncbi:MAG TPA: type II toxin-antitoxin system VapC family toxin [Candidatus Eisenbacteria bacterium]
MSIVVDASALLCLAFDDEAVPYGSALIDAIPRENAVSPSILWYELRNALVTSERRGRIEPELSAAFLVLTGQLPIALREPQSEAGILDLARRFKLTVYDAAYLDLAILERAALATLDDGLKAAARELGVPHWQPE